MKKHMIRATGLALLALVCVSAVGASVAQANNVTSTTGVYPIRITGADEKAKHGELISLTVGGVRKVECTVNFQEATLAKEETKITVSPFYSECFSNGLTATPATVTTNGCDFIAEATSKVAGQGSILCPTGKEIEVHIYENETKHKEGKSLCTWTIPSQGPLKGLTLVLNSAGTHTEFVTVELNVPEIEITGDGANKLVCGIENGAKGKVGTTRGSYFTTGETDNEAKTHLPFMIA